MVCSRSRYKPSSLVGEHNGVVLSSEEFDVIVKELLKDGSAKIEKEEHHLMVFVLDS
jgi:hypothetical protein